MLSGWTATEFALQERNVSTPQCQPGGMASIRHNKPR